MFEFEKKMSNQLGLHYLTNFSSSLQFENYSSNWPDFSLGISIWRFLYFFSNSDSDDEEYWFQNADPKRPKINQPPVKNVPKRIFHKLEPQVRPTLEQLSPSNLVNNVRLPRKTILNKESPDLDLDDELSNSSSSPSLMKRNPDTKLRK